MTELRFEILDARLERYAAVPTLAFRLRLDDSSEQRIHTIVLNTQIRIEPGRRRYEPGEQDRLVEVFGDSSRWADTLKPFLWVDRTLSVPGFTTTTEIDLRVPCTYDLEVTAGKYFEGLDDGEIPLIFLFSGTIFVRGSGDGVASGADGVSVEQVPWELDARYRLPVSLWRELVDVYWPGAGWLRLPRDTIAALQAFKARRAIPTWDAAVTRLLDESATPPGAGVDPRRSGDQVEVQAWS